MANDIFNYLEDKIKENESAIFKEKKMEYNLDNIFKIVEQFIIDKKLICYGGTALNNILPKDTQFYNYDVSSPDYDFFSKDALNDVKELANIFKKKKYKQIQAKSAIHNGTYKLYVNYIPVADITQMNETIFDKLSKDCIIRDDIRYAPIHFLRMNLFLELSRPRGDLTRWEKILKRLIILNQAYPFTITDCIQKINYTSNNSKNETHFNMIKKILLEEDNNVFIGEFAITKYSKHFPTTYKKIVNTNKYPTFITINSDTTTYINKIKENNNITVKKVSNIDDVLPTFYKLFIDNILYGIVIQTEGCQSYNEITVNKKQIKIGNLDTMLFYYFMFFYLDIDSKNTGLLNNLYCYAYILFYLQENYKKSNNNLLQRFNISCIGYQTTFEDIIDNKYKLYEKLRKKGDKKEIHKYFLKYTPRNTVKKKSKTKTKTKTKFKSKSKSKKKSKK